MLASLGLLALAGSVAARTGPLGPTNNYIAPTGLQIGTISQNIKCNATLQGLLVIKNADFNLVLGGALPNTVGPSQSYYLTGRAVVTGSLNFTAQVQKLGVTSIKGTLNSTVILTPGSVAGSIDVAKLGRTITVPPQAVQNNTPIVINIPNTNETALQVGPIAPASGASQISIAVGSAVFNTNATFSNGQQLPVIVTCPAVTPTNYLAFTTVGGSATGNLGPNADYKPVTSIPALSLIGSTGLTYSCVVSGVSGTLSVPTSLTTFADSLNATRGTVFHYLNSHGTINITQSQVNQLQATFTPTASSFRLQVNSIAATGTNINPTTVPILSGAVSSDNIPISSSATVYQVDIPGANGLLPPVNFTAGTTPGTAYIYLGNANVNIIALSSSGSILKTFTANCTAPTTPQIPLLPRTII